MSGFEAGDRVAIEWVFSGTPVVPLGPDGVVSGKSFSVRATSIFDLEDGLIHRASDYYNVGTIHAQLASDD